MLPFPQVIGCIVSAYLVGTRVAAPTGMFLLKPLLGAAAAGAAVARPTTGLLGPFRLSGKALGFLFGWAQRNQTSAGTQAPAELLHIQEAVSTSDLMTIYVRKHAYAVGVSVLYLTGVVVGSYVFYKVSIYVIYRLYQDIKKSWYKLHDEKNSKLTPQQLKAIQLFIGNNSNNSSTKPKLKNSDYVIYNR